MRTFPCYLLTLLLVTLPTSSDAQLKDALYRILQIKKTTFEEKTLAKANEALAKKDAPGIAEAFLAYEERKKFDYKKDLPPHNSSDYFYSPHWNQLLAEFIKGASSQDIWVLAEGVGLLLENKAHPTLYSLEGGPLQFRAKLHEELLAEKESVAEKLDRFSAKFTALPEQAQWIVGAGFSLWLTRTNKMWDEREWKQARNWLKLHSEYEGSVGKYLRAGLSARALFAQRIRRQPWISESTLTGYDRELTNLIGDQSIPSDIRMSTAVQMLISAQDAVNCPKFFTTTLELIEEAEALGKMPMMWARWWTNIASILKLNDPALIERLGDSLEGALGKAKQGGEYYPPLLLGKNNYGIALALSLAAKKEELAKDTALHWFRADDFQGHFETILSLIQLGEFDMAEELLPSTGERFAHRYRFRAGPDLYEKLDLFYEKIQDPIQDLKIELALANSSSQWGGEYQWNQYIVDQRVEARLGALSSVSELPTSAQLLFLESFADMFRLDLASNHFQFDVSEIEELLIDVDTSSESRTITNATASLMIVALNDGNKELWEGLFGLVQNEAIASSYSIFRLNKQFTALLASMVLFDVLNEDLEDYPRKSKWITDFCEYRFKNLKSARLDPREILQLYSITRIANALGETKFNGGKLLNVAPEAARKAIRNSQRFEGSVYYHLREFKFSDRLYQDFSVRRSLLRDIYNKLFSHPKIVALDLFLPKNNFSAEPYIFSADEFPEFFNSESSNPVSTAFFAVGWSRERVKIKWGAEERRQKLKHSIENVPAKPEWEALRAALKTALAEEEILHGDSTAGLKLLQEVSPGKNPDHEKWIASIRENSP